MSILSGYKKFKKYLKTTDGYQLISYFTSSDTVNMVDENGNITDTTLTESINQAGKGREITQAEYDALSEEEKKNGTVYYITDDEGVVLENACSIAFNNAGTDITATNVQAAIEELENNAFSGDYNNLSNKPASLKNPQKLTFTGGVTETYDGSVAKSVAIPTTLPANGGNSDTVDNKHASDFILKSGGTMSGALNFANNTWNLVGDDVYIGDRNIPGCLALKPKLGIATGSGIYLFSDWENWKCKFVMESGGQCTVGSEQADTYLITAGSCYVSNNTNSARAPIHASNFVQSSSRRIKENIEEMTKEEARKILLLNPVTYDYKNKENGTGCRGLLAEDVAPIIPSCVIGDVNCADDDEKSIEAIGIDYSKLVPYLVKMVQMQQDEINELKNVLGKS